MASVQLQTGRAVGNDIESMRKCHGDEFYSYELSAKRVHGRVMDIACGTGTGTRLLAHHAQEVVGVDIDEDALEFCRKHHQAPNLQFIQADATARLPFPDGHFDTIVTLETIEHLYPDQRQRYLAELLRTLKDDGTMLISTPQNGLDEQTRPCPAPQHLYDHTIEFCLRELRAELEAAGFEIVRVGGIQHRLDPRLRQPVTQGARAKLLRMIHRAAQPITKRVPIWAKERVGHAVLGHPYHINNFYYTEENLATTNTFYVELRKRLTVRN